MAIHLEDLVSDAQDLGVGHQADLRRRHDVESALWKPSKDDF